MPDRTGRRVVALFGPYRRRVAVVAVTILISSLLGITLPFLTQAIFDRALFPRTVEGSIGQPRIGLLVALVGASIAITLLGALLAVAQTWLATRLGNAVMRDLRDRLFAHLQRMELAFFTSTRTGEIQSRLGNDVAGVQSVVTDTASSILGNTVTVVSALVAMLVLSWRLTLVAVVLLPVFVLLQVRVGRVRRKVAGATQRSVADMTAITQETLSVSGVLLAKVFDRQQAEVERYSAENARQADLQVRQTMTGQSFFATVQAFFGLTPALVYLVAGLSIGGVFLAGGAATLTAGTIVAFTTLQTRLLFPVVQLLRVGVDVQTSLALFERVFEYLDLEPAIVERPGAVDLVKEDVAGHVTFEDVRFRYGGGDRAGADGAQPWTLDGVSLDVPAGSLVAFVGPQRCREDHRVLPGAPAVRRRRGPGHPRRPRRPGPHSSVAGTGDRRGDAGVLPLPRIGAGQPAVRASRRQRRGDRGGGSCGQHPRPDPAPRRRLRHDGGGARGTGSRAVRNSGWPSRGYSSPTRGC
jgi:ATP-binding cassette subfamily B protein